MKNTTKNIFEFNHTDKSLSESDIETLKDFYKHYYKKYWCFKKSYKRYKLLDEKSFSKLFAEVFLSSVFFIMYFSIQGD